MEENFSRKDSITRTAIEIIDEMGIQGLSIRELAKRQGVTEPAIYRHFESKRAIILSVLEFFSESGNRIMKYIENKNLDARDAILFFIKSHAELFEEYPAVSSVVFSEEIFRDDPVVAAYMKEIFDTRSRFIMSLVDKGQREGKISKCFSSEDFADVILGVKRRITLKWRMNSYNFPLAEKVVGIVENILRIT